MNATLWILIGVLALVIIVALLILLGLKRSKAKQVSFEKKDELEQKKPSSGDYQAQGGFNFTAGGGSTTNIGGVTVEDAAKGDKEPQKAPAVSPTDSADNESVTIAPTPEVEDDVAQADAHEPVKPVEMDKVEELDDDELDVPEAPQAPSANKGAAAGVAGAAAATAAGATAAAGDNTADPQGKATEDESAGDESAGDESVEPDITDTEVELSENSTLVDVPEKTESETREEIAPVQGRLGKLRGNLSKSQNVIGRGVLGILSAGDLDEDAWEEIEDTLIMADLGAKTTAKVVDDLRERIAVNGVSSEAEARSMLRAALIQAGKPDLDRSIKAMPYEGKPAVIMVVGVNGTGKTTTTGKLSRVLVGMGHKVLLGAADTFRAAAADQLETWGRRVGADTVRGKEGADPASVAFDAVATGIDSGVDVVLVDTAGRLHTSVGLMDQLGKVKRVVEKKAKVDEVLLVLDATVGQNGLAQARIFREVVDITGVVLTKLDGTAKGGIVFQVQEELGVPVKLVGLGEGADHLAPFEVESFVDALLG